MTNASSNATDHAADVVSGVADSLPENANDAAGPVLDVVADKLGGSTTPATGTGPGNTPQPGANPRPGPNPPPGNTPQTGSTPRPGNNAAPDRNAPSGTDPSPGQNGDSGNHAAAGRNGSAGEQRNDGGPVNDAPSTRAASGSRGADREVVRPVPQVAPSRTLGRPNPPSVGGIDPRQTGVQAPPPPGMRAPTDAAGGGITGVAKALRFPTLLLALLLAFLALQQRADRSDPKLARAPIGGAQDWLEFR